jgi:hypothetical protein
VALKRRMITPDLFADPDLEPASKRVLFAGMLSMAEDSGCMEWKAGLLKAFTLPFDPATITDVQGWMDELTTAGRAWTYQREGRTYAFLPDFPRWQGRLIRWGAPDTVPLPSGIRFTPAEAKERRGSGTYEWPAGLQALDPTEFEPKSKEGSVLDRTVLEPKELAPSLPASSDLVADNDDAQAIKALSKQIGKERTSQALRAANAHAKKAGTALTDAILRFYLEAQVEEIDAAKTTTDRRSPCPSHQ